MDQKEQVFGVHAVLALLKVAPHRLREILIYRGRRDQKARKIVEATHKLGLSIRFVERKELDSLCPGNHQGIIAIVEPGKDFDEQDLYNMAKDAEIGFLILALDGVTDPHNLGACLRSADAAGVRAVIIPKDNSAGLNNTARKVASGAAESIPLIAVTNLARCLKKLQHLGLWVTGLAGEADCSVFDADLTGQRVIVMGAEGSGLRRLTKETCDALVSIPMQGTVSSLNVSVATGVVLFEVLRQRTLSA